MRVAVDAMGGDRAPRVVVEGAVAAVRETGVGVTLVGAPDVLRAELDRVVGSAALDITIAPAAEVVGMGEAPARALRRKPQASIKVAAELVANGEADALFSAGNTGAKRLQRRRPLQRPMWRGSLKPRCREQGWRQGRCQGPGGID